MPLLQTNEHVLILPKLQDTSPRTKSFIMRMHSTQDGKMDAIAPNQRACLNSAKAARHFSFGRRSFSSNCSTLISFFTSTGLSFVPAVSLESSLDSFSSLGISGFLRRHVAVKVT